MSTAIRGFTTGALLVVVWMNSHWSVALAISLLTVANELAADQVSLLRERIKRGEK